MNKIILFNRFKSSKKLVIRKIGVDDISLIDDFCKISIECFPKFPDFLSSRGAWKHWFFNFNSIEMNLLHGLIAIKDKQPVATILFQLENTKINLWRLFHVATLPNYRGQGIADRLLDQVIEKIALFGGTRIILDVDKSLKPAIGLYRKHQFVKLGNFHSNDRENSLKSAIKILMERHIVTK